MDQPSRIDGELPFEVQGEGFDGHARFREAVRGGKPFEVTQLDVLNAQVVVEAAHRSALNGSTDYAVSRSDDLAEYEALCRHHGLIGD